MTTIFAQIIQGKLPCVKVFENARILAIKDKYPVAPVHLLIIPKKAFKDLQSIPQEELDIIPETILIAQKLAIEYGVADNYRFLTNTGSAAGQSIFHLHFHLIGGRDLGPMA